jgi:hypothetical protein
MAKKEEAVVFVNRGFAPRDEAEANFPCEFRDPPYFLDGQLVIDIVGRGREVHTVPIKIGGDNLTIASKLPWK